MAPRRPRDTRADAERSFEQLYRGHRVDVYRAALRELGNVHDAEDVTQAAFVDAYRAVLRGTRPQAPRAWLLMIAENVRRRRLRTSLRRPREEPLDADAALAAEASHEQAGALLEALGTLTAEQREAFLLREITGLSYDEIAQRTGSSVGSVQMLLFRARKTLRGQLEPPHLHGLLVPLTTLFARFEGLRFAPRAVGAIGAAALAVGVSASGPAKADPPAAAQAPPPRATAVADQALLAAVPARQVPAATRSSQRRRGETTVPVPVPARPAPTAVAHPQPAPSTTPVTAPSPATPTKSPVAVAAVPTPPVSIPALLEPVVESALEPLVQPVLEPVLEPLVAPLLESAGAAGAAGAGAPPLPVLPLDPLPPGP